MSKSINDMSGRSLSKARRKSKLSGGGSGAVRATRASGRKRPEPIVPVLDSGASVAASSVKVGAVSAPVQRQPLPSQPPVKVAEGRELAKQKRRQMIRGKTSTSSRSVAQGSLKVRKKPDELLELRPVSRPASVASASKGKCVSPSTNVQIKSEALSGRNVSKARRKALAKGKAGQSSFKSQGGQSSTIAKMVNPNASVREVARVVRAERCSKGKVACSGTANPSRRQRRKNQSGAPEKVSFSETLSGGVVSGTLVGRGSLTGVEKGACKVVSGTEYLGTEEFTGHCPTVPEPAPSKVTFTQTSKGRTVSGVKMGQASSVTGDRSGVCSPVTGTEYLPADQSDLFCGTEQGGAQPSSGAKSVTPTVMKPAGSVSPVAVSAPAKVVASTTFAGNVTTGTQVGRPDRIVTGDERGYCQTITGTGYQGKEEVSTACGTAASPVTPPEKVTVSGTMGGQIVTGDRSGNIDKMTGAETGACQPVSGTPYVGTEAIAENCSAEDQALVAQRTNPASTEQASNFVTGVQPGMTGLTGAQKGACEVVSGTRYQSTAEVSQLCESSGAASPGESDYPVKIGQATATTLANVPSTEPVSSASTITGDGWEKGGKVTGTDGAWAAKRNPSIRGVHGQAPMGAANFRPRSMPDVPSSPITGSSGNTSEGSKVTLSGGARA